MSRYIYKSPKECSRALQLIAEQMDPETESANALYTAIGYLTSMQIESDQKRKEAEEKNNKVQKMFEIQQNKKKPIEVGDEVKIFDDDDEKGYFKVIVIDIDVDGALWVLDEYGANTIINPDDERKREKTGRHVNYIKDMLYEMEEGATDGPF